MKIIKIRRYFSPFFASKYYILKGIKYAQKNYNFNGHILDFGCGNKPYEYLFAKTYKYEGIDFDNFSKNKDFLSAKPDYFFNKNYTKSFKLQFGDNTFDSALALQVLEHHPRPQIMISELCRVVRHNGIILITVPFMGGIHEAPNDYHRFTKYGLELLFKDNNLEIIEMQTQGSTPSTISNLLNEHLNGFAAKSKMHYLLSAVIFTPFLIYSYLSIILDKIFKSHAIFTNYQIILKVKKN